MLGNRDPIVDMTDIGPSLTKFVVKETSYYKDHTHINIQLYPAIKDCKKSGFCEHTK